MRSQEAELIDLGPSHYSSDEYQDCLFQLDRIAKTLGGDRATFWAFDRLEYAPASILDVGCGGGLFTLRLASRFPQAKVVGIDISKGAIAIANENLLKNGSPSNVKFVVQEMSEPYDVVTATLMTHHLTDSELISFITQACRLAKRTVILNDLHRHWLATAGFATLAPILFNNRLIIHDGLISIRRAFTRKDWKSYLTAAGIDPKAYKITWHWPFRWIVTIDTV